MACVTFCIISGEEAWERYVFLMYPGAGGCWCLFHIVQKWKVKLAAEQKDCSSAFRTIVCYTGTFGCNFFSGLETNCITFSHFACQAGVRG